MIDTRRLREEAAALGVELDGETAEKFDVYARLLIEWNQRINLTAIVEPDEILVKHFLDSLTVARHMPSGAIRLIDVGTGAGFPGIPLKLVRPQMRLFLLDSLQKRLAFLETACRELRVPAELIHSRAEEAGILSEQREANDLATARAVAALPVLAEYCLPLVRVGGRFVAMKGPEGEKEAQSAQKAIDLLGGEIEKIEEISIGDGANAVERRLIIIGKTKPTPREYPRNAKKIKQQPL